MGSPCGEESYPYDSDPWIKCVICGELIPPSHVRYFYYNRKNYAVCNAWNDILPCAKLPYLTLQALNNKKYRKKVLKLRESTMNTIKQGLIAIGHSEHCANYMISINRKNCICHFH